MEDAILEQEIVQNERLIVHSKYGNLRLRRPTPAMDALIADQRRIVYHTDLKDDTILTKEEIAKILERRGVWNTAADEEIQNLTLRSGDIMAKLTALGYAATTDLITDTQEAQRALRGLFTEDQVEAQESLERIFMSEDLPEDEDIKILKDLNNQSEDALNDALTEFQILIMQAQLIDDFIVIKKSLNVLLETYTKFFGDTIEERANRTERMAHVFYCVTHVEDDSSLWDNFKDMWHEDPQDVAWLHSQLFYFQNGITDEYAGVLQDYGFMARVVDTGLISEVSQDPPPASSDGESLEETPQASLESEVVTI